MAPVPAPAFGAPSPMLLQRKIQRRALQRRQGKPPADPYAPAHATRVYPWGKHHALVFAPPPDRIKPPGVDVMLFFHGLGGDYTSKSTNNTSHDNAAIAGDRPAFK